MTAAEGRKGISELLAERFAQAYFNFLAEIKQSLEQARDSQESSVQADVRAWLQILPVLEKNRNRIEAAMVDFGNGDAALLVIKAEEMRGLAKHLDGLSLSFAGSEHEEQFNLLLKSIVLSAARICDLAGVP